jgi:hypothetical protein
MKAFIGLLTANFIRLDEEVEDSICLAWNEKSGGYTTKLGYQLLEEEEFTVRRNGGGPLSGGSMLQLR